MRSFVVLVFVFICFSCRKNSCNEIPACISAKIETLKSQPKGNPAYSVYQYSYNGQKVYYFPPQCCDRYSDLYGENCNLICHPDGGIIGSGDGACRNFFANRTNEVLIWKDNR